MRRSFLLTLLLSGLFLLGWADRIDPKVAREIAQTVANGYTKESLRSNSQTVSLVYAAAAGQEGLNFDQMEPLTRWITLCSTSGRDRVL